MKKRTQTSGVCQLCQGVFSKAAMTRHLAQCLAAHEKPATGKALSKGGPKKGKLFHLVVQGKYNPEYWMHLEMPGTATLRDLDDFLRDTWLECCGHLSAFQIGNTQFSVQTNAEAGTPWFAPDWPERNMDVRLGEVLRPELKFSHEYDFGSTTDLELRVVGEREGAASRKEPVRLLARNEPPEIRCERCKRPAAWVDTFEGGWLCEECLGDKEEGVLPVVNSPRVGVCGYAG
jgi:Plasmid pRiA4b ORF-3-like protein